MPLADWLAIHPDTEAHKRPDVRYDLSYELHEVAAAAGVGWTEFMGLDPYTRARLVAHHRVRALLQLVGEIHQRETQGSK